MANYFNQLSLRDQLHQLGQCRFMDLSEFNDGVLELKGKKIVIIGCGAQGLNQGLNMRDSGLDISYALRENAIKEKRESFINSTKNNFNVGTIEELVPNAEKYIGIDKYNTNIPSDLQKSDITFLKSEVPPLTDIEEKSVDCVVTFQVIEHIYDDEFFLQEIHRVLKPGGKLILTTPNSIMSLTRNPWHIREYSPEEMIAIIKKIFNNCELYGVFGNNKVMKYYNKNKDAVRKITRFDILNMQYWLPRWMLQIPYDILNRFNRHNLHDKEKEIVA